MVCCKHTDVRILAQFLVYNCRFSLFCLAGTKSFVVNAADSNLFLVAAQTETNDRKGDKKNALSIFLVNSTLPGVKIQRKNKTIGRTNLCQATIKFDDVTLSKGRIFGDKICHLPIYFVISNLFHIKPIIITDSILSIPGSGDYIQRKIQLHSRINQGLLHLTQMKHILQYMMNMVESTECETGAEKYVF